MRAQAACKQSKDAIPVNGDIHWKDLMGALSATDQQMMCNFGRMGQCSLRKDIQPVGCFTIALLRILGPWIKNITV